MSRDELMFISAHRHASDSNNCSAAKSVFCLSDQCFQMTLSQKLWFHLLCVVAECETRGDPQCTILKNCCYCRAIESLHCSLLEKVEQSRILKLKFV